MHRALYIVALTPAVLMAAPADSVSFAKSIQPFLATNCYGCHNAKLKSGEVDLTSYRSAEAITAARMKCRRRARLVRRSRI
jgi:hypothetical protein